MGSITYSLDGTNYSTDIPTGTNAGTYSVYYKVAGNDNYNEFVSASPVSVSISKATPTVTAPTATNPIYTGAAQGLITAGTTTGGEMRYALDTATEATQLYTTSIPTATNAGTYHVWYIGDKGEKVRIPRQILEDIVRFVIDHMSNYVIEFDDGNLKDDDDLTFVMLEEPGQPAETKTFTDVKEGDYFHDAVMWAVENGVIAGKPDGTFDPDTAATREQFVVMLYALSKLAN